MTLGRILVLVLLASVPVAICWWGVRTCRTLWRHGSTEWGRLVYDVGVRGFGVSVAVVMVACGGYIGAKIVALSSADAVPCAIAGAIFCAVFGMPVALGLGYFWGTQMAWFEGLEPDKDRLTAKRKGLSPRPN
jgi:hypothetical protein